MDKRKILLTSILFITFLFLLTIPSEAYNESHDVIGPGSFRVNLEWECNTGVTGSFTSNATIYAYIERTLSSISIKVLTIWNVTSNTGSFDVDFDSGYDYELVFENNGSDAIHINYTIDCKLQIPGFEI
jgi:hypothetical protein